MNTGEHVWAQVDVTAEQAVPYMKRFQAEHPDLGLFVRRNDGSLLTKLSPKGDADDCLEQLGLDSSRFLIFYEDAQSSVRGRP
jgi:hypothetical protein